MPRPFSLFLVLATLSAGVCAAQSAGPAQSTSTSAFIETDPRGSYTQPQSAPIERAMPGTRTAQFTSSQPIPGVWLRSRDANSVQTLSAAANGTEIRLDHGRANLSVHHPEQNAQILVDLPGGQTAIVKDGLYTFNADTNTVRVLSGEADAFPVADGKAEVKVKEDHEFTFGSGEAHAREVGFAQARADLLPTGAYGNGYRSYGDGYYGYGPYGDGFVYGGYPYYGWGYPYWAYGWGPWGWGYPWGFGVGFYGGGYFGGYRGGYGGFGGGGGFHPRR